MDDDVDRSEVTPDELEEARRYAMTIEWSIEDEAFIVSVPDLPGVHTHGATREEAAAMGDEVVAIVITALRDAGRPVPPPSFSAMHDSIKDPLANDAAQIQQFRRGLHMSQQDFAGMLNVSVATIRSWEQGLRTPDGAAKRLLSIAERRPDVLLEAASPSLKQSA